jgi:hypothetical protein
LQEIKLAVLKISTMNRKIISILLATLWISLSEFIRNQFILQEYWVEHYKKLGLTFPAAPVNGAVWGVWSLCFAIVVYFVARQFNLLAAAALSWCIGFLLMWLVIGNLGVLPYGILPIAIPLSMLEAFVAAWIIKKHS